MPFPVLSIRSRTQHALLLHRNMHPSRGRHHGQFAVTLVAPCRLLTAERLSRHAAEKSAASNPGCPPVLMARRFTQIRFSSLHARRLLPVSAETPRAAAAVSGSFPLITRRLLCRFPHRPTGLRLRTGGIHPLQRQLRGAMVPTQRVSALLPLFASAKQTDEPRTNAPLRLCQMRYSKISRTNACSIIEHSMCHLRSTYEAWHTTCINSCNRSDGSSDRRRVW